MRTVALFLRMVAVLAVAAARLIGKRRPRERHVVLFDDAHEESPNNAVRPSFSVGYLRSAGPALPLAIAGAALVLSAVAFLIDFSLTPRRAPFTRALDGTVTQLTSERGVEAQPSLSPDARSIAYRSDVDGAGDILVRRIDGDDVVNVTSELTGDASEPAFSPDGRQIAFRSTHGNGGIFVVDREGGPARRLTNFGSSPAWTADGASIVFATRSTMDPRIWNGPSEGWVVSVDSGELTRLVRRDFREPAVSPDGRRIAYSSSGQPRPGARRVSAIWTSGIDGRNPRMVSGGFSIDWSPVWSPDGAFVYFLSDRGEGTVIARVPIDNRNGRAIAEPVRLDVNAGSASHLTMAAGTGQIAWSTVEWRPALFRVPFDADTRSVRGNPRAVFARPVPWKCGEPSPDGTAIALTTEGEAPDVYLLAIETGELRAITHDAAAEGCPRWSPDGRMLAFHSNAGGSTRLWLAEADGSNVRLAGPALGPLSSPVWAPDGRSLVAWDARASGLRLVRLPDGGRASSENLPSPPHPFTPVDWSPDGTQIAGTAAGNLWLYVVASRSYEPLMPGDAPVWLATSRRLLFASDGRLMMLDLSSRYTREILAVPDLHLDSPMLSAGDRFLYFNQNAIEANIWLLTLR